MTTPRNPFKLKASQAEEPHRIVTLVEAPPREQVKALIDMWANEGVDALLEGMEAFTANIETMAVRLDTSASEHADKERAYRAASLGKQLEAHRAVVSARNPKPGAVGALYLKPVSIGKDEPQCP